MPRPIARPTPPPIDLFADPTIRPLTAVDVDAVWDWLRTDARAAEALALLRSSRDLHVTVDQLQALADIGQAAIVAVDAGGVLAGVAILYPIALPIAVAHLYLAPERRGRGASGLLRRLVALAT